jgi:hypothetical protein
MVSVAARCGILKLRLATVAGVALLVLAGAGRASATNTGRVTVCPSGCDYAMIQDAINAAPRRAIIIVAAGTYAGFSIPGTNSALTNVTLLGAGAATTTISGAGEPDGSPVVANLGVSVRIRDVTITGSDTDPVVAGSGILNNGTLTLDNTTVSGNSSMFGAGGISNAGTLTLKDSTVTDNDSNGGDCGGGIDNSGTLTLKDSTVSHNDSSRGSGGGICNETRSTATVTMKDSTVSGNSSMFGAGGISNAGTLTVKGSTVSDNSGGLGGGGGIDNENGTVALTDSTVSGNDGTGAGGGIINAGTLVVKDSRVSDNGAADGGGVYSSGPLTVKNSVVSNNTANEGGGIYDANGEVTLANSTISGNTPDNCFPPESVAGCSG